MSGEGKAMNHQRVRWCFVICALVWLMVGVSGRAAAGEAKPGGTLKMGQVGGMLNFDAHR
jgi:hypothetical protein